MFTQSNPSFRLATSISSWAVVLSSSSWALYCNDRAGLAEQVMKRSQWQTFCRGLHDTLPPAATEFYQSICNKYLVNNAFLRNLLQVIQAILATNFLQQDTSIQ